MQAGTEPAADFTLDEQEWSALIDAGLPDAVISILHDQAPELLPRDRRAAFHAEVQATCELAHRPTWHPGHVRPRGLDRFLHDATQPA
ncbi:hypothetical protein [Caldimonas sp.]|uniref:hypothetical protein n=1 Tax=Caldimonas sp. TaxID=2838790 RepID=UPI0039188280